MTTRYPGGLIRKTPPTITPPVGGEGGSAPGVWTLEQASYYTKIGTWPKPIIQRQLWASGYNVSGYIGDGTTISRSSAVQIGSDTTWLQVNSSYTFSIGSKTNGTIYGWGAGQYGVTGTGDEVTKSSPVQIGALTTWTANIANGFYHTLALRSDGTLWAWGWSNFGQIGNNFRGAVGNDGISSPVQIGADTNWSKVGAGYYASYAIKTNGTLWAWGANADGQLGLNDQVSRSSPVQVGADTTWARIISTQRTVIAVKTNGTLWTWGHGTYGQLGDGTSVTRSSPVQIGALTNWNLVAGGNYQVLATKTDGTLWSWGSNFWGTLGLGDVVDRSSPVQVGSGTTWLYIGQAYQASVASKTDKTLWTWGRNNFGKLGQNNTINLSSPVQVASSSSWGVVTTNSPSGNVVFAITAI